MLEASCISTSEGRFATGDIVRGSDTGEDAVSKSEMGGFGRNEGADLRQKHDEGGLTKEGGLTAHVRPGDDHDLRLLVVEVHVIRHVALPEGELLLDDGVAPSTDIDDEAIMTTGQA